MGILCLCNYSNFLRFYSLKPCLRSKCEITATFHMKKKETQEKNVH